MIQIENINVSYKETLALDNITLNLEGPSITGIIGPNGAGKSTLIKTLIGIIPHSGKLLFNTVSLCFQKLTLNADIDSLPT